MGDRDNDSLFAEPLLFTLAVLASDSQRSSSVPSGAVRTRRAAIVSQWSKIARGNDARSRESSIAKRVVRRMRQNYVCRLLNAELLEF